MVRIAPACLLEAKLMSLQERTFEAGSSFPEVLHFSLGGFVGPAVDIRELWRLSCIFVALGLILSSLQIANSKVLL